MGWLAEKWTSSQETSGLTHAAAADSHAVLLRFKVIAVTPAAPKHEGGASARLHHKIPAG